MSDYVQNICQTYLQTQKSMSWLIEGADGVGKMDLVQSVAQKLLGPQGMASGFKVLECGLTEDVKKKIQKEILEGRAVGEVSEEDKKNEITVDDVRQVMGFLSLKTSLPCKILVVSLAEQMNINAQNAFLKTLEEPFEKTLIFLLSENPSRLLPTILSRCQKIHLHPLKKEELIEQIQSKYPNEENAQWIAEVADGMPGLAEKICQYDGVSLYNKLNSFFVPIHVMDLSQLLAFSKDISKNTNQFFLVMHFIQYFLHQQAILNSLDAGQNYIRLYQWVQSMIRKTDSLYLDRAQVLTDTLLKISENLS